MKKNVIRFIALALIALMCLALLPMAAFAAELPEDKGDTHTQDNCPGNDWDSQTGTCKVCGKEHEHGFTDGNWVTDTEPSCFASGTKHRTCSVCGYTETGTIPATEEHSYADSFTVDTEASCTQPGSKSRHCTTSGCTAKTEITEIPAAHSYNDFGECSRCGRVNPVLGTVIIYGNYVRDGQPAGRSVTHPPKGEAYALSWPYQNPGSRLTGFNTEADGSGTPYGPTATFTPTDDTPTLEVYAQWQAQSQNKESLSLVLVPGIEGVQNITREVTPPILAPENPFTPPQGKHFVCWTSGANGFGDRYAPGDQVSFEAGYPSVNLYAKWADDSGNASAPTADDFVVGCHGYSPYTYRKQLGFPQPDISMTDAYAGTFRYGNAPDSINSTLNAAQYTAENDGSRLVLTEAFADSLADGTWYFSFTPAGGTEAIAIGSFTAVSPEEITVTFHIGANGTVTDGSSTIGSGPATLLAGKQYILEITPDEGYIVTHLVGLTGVDSPNTFLSFTPEETDDNKTIRVDFGRRAANAKPGFATGGLRESEAEAYQTGCEAIYREMEGKISALSSADQRKVKTSMVNVFACWNNNPSDPMTAAELAALTEDIPITLRYPAGITPSVRGDYDFTVYHWHEGQVSIIACTPGDNGVSFGCRDFSPMAVLATPKTGNTAAPTVSIAPSDSSVTVVTRDTELTATFGPVGASIQWTRNGTPISGATADKYVVQEADLGKAIRCRVSYGGSTATSAPITPVETVTVQVSYNSYGSVKVGNEVVPSGTSKTVAKGTAFTLVPKSGARIKQVKKDNAQVGNSSSCTFQANGKLEVVFEQSRPANAFRANVSDPAAPTVSGNSKMYAYDITLTLANGDPVPNNVVPSEPVPFTIPYPESGMTASSHTYTLDHKVSGGATESVEITADEQGIHGSSLSFSEFDLTTAPRAAGTKPAAPKVSVKQDIYNDAPGSFSGLASTQEYLAPGKTPSSASASDWKPVSTSLKAAKPGDYYFRIKKNGDTPASDATKVTVKAYYKVTAGVNRGHGTVDPDTSKFEATLEKGNTLATTWVEKGKSYTVTFHPARRYYVETVFDSGEYVGKKGSYTIAKVNAPHMIVVNFTGCYSPRTADDSNIPLWTTLCCASLAGFGAVWMILRRRREE